MEIDVFILFNLYLTKKKVKLRLKILQRNYKHNNEKQLQYREAVSSPISVDLNVFKEIRSVHFQSSCNLFHEEGAEKTEKPFSQMR